MLEEKREVNVQEFEDDGDETVVSAEDAQSLEQDPVPSPGVESEVEAEKEEAKVPAETQPEEADAETEHSEPKPVEGETLRERALRKEIERLRAEKRDIVKSSVLNKAKAPQPEIDISELLAEGYTEQDIESSKKLIATLAPAM